MTEKVRIEITSALFGECQMAMIHRFMCSIIRLHRAQSSCRIDELQVSDAN